MATLIQLGEYTINLDTLLYIEHRGTVMLLHFSGSEQVMPLSGAPAAELGAWLETHAHAARTPVRLPPEDPTWRDAGEGVLRTREPEPLGLAQAGPEGTT